MNQSADWPPNFIVQPDRSGSQPADNPNLPVLTDLVDPSDNDDSSEWPDSHAAGDAAHPFVPTVFGPKLRRVGEDGAEIDFDDSDELHADPDAAPASIGAKHSAFANWSFLWLVMLLLLGLAAAAWAWWPSLRQS